MSTATVPASPAAPTSRREKAPGFELRYLPLLSSFPASQDGLPADWRWFPLHVLLEQLSRCRCGAPAGFVVSALSLGPGGDPYGACISACRDHVCELSRLVCGHESCPKCNIRWVGPAEFLTAEFIARAIEGGAP